MARKYKRSVSAGSSTQSASSANNAVEKAAPAFTRRATTAEFNPDYTYVLKDLKRIGTLAGTFFVVLVVLSFFLNH
jgi:hypothetical protein